MIKHINSIDFNEKIKHLVSTWEQDVFDLIEKKGLDYCFDGNKFVGFKNMDSNQDYGLGRIENKATIECCVKEALYLSGISDKKASTLSKRADMLFFGEVDEHVDGCGERYLLVLRAPNGFELNTEDEEGELFSEPIFSNQLYLFNESLPHSITRYSYSDISPFDNNKDFCIAINIPVS